MLLPAIRCILAAKREWLLVIAALLATQSVLVMAVLHVMLHVGLVHVTEVILVTAQIHVRVTLAAKLAAAIPVMTLIPVMVGAAAAIGMLHLQVALVS